MLSRVSLVDLIKMCKAGIKAAKSEMKKRWNLDWDEFYSEHMKNVKRKGK